MSKSSLMFSITDRVGGLADVLQNLKELDLNMTRIESRPSRTRQWDYDFFVDFCGASSEKLQSLAERLKSIGIDVVDVLLADDERSLEFSSSSRDAGSFHHHHRHHLLLVLLVLSIMLLCCFPLCG